MTNFSTFGKRFTRESGIAKLMQDLGEANQSNDPEICMLGGGNPALIPEATAIFTKEVQDLLDNGHFDKALGTYSTQQGDDAFLEVLATFFNDRYDWGITKKNIVLTNGSQNSFFNLFNLLAGEMPDGKHKKILFPLSPEYIGYSDLGLSDDMFTSIKPTIKRLDEQQFKYYIDFNKLDITDDIAAICVSRPTNPTGNVITNEELAKLDALAKDHNIPLIIDNAYGLPFPGAIYTDTRPTWNENIVMGMSLSKFGLPGVRTGIMVADESIISAMSNINGITCLSPNNFGAHIAKRLFADQEVVGIRENIVRPFYKQKMENALALAQSTFADLPVYIHKPEGAFFLWLWCDGLSITSKELYERLKKRKVYVIPGEDFFIGLDRSWKHQSECLRINYVLSDDQLERGLKILAEELSSLYS